MATNTYTAARVHRRRRRHRARTAVQKLREQADAVVERIQPQIAAVSNYVRDEPTKALLISAAAGAALMGLFALIVRSSGRSQGPGASASRSAMAAIRTLPSTSPKAPRRRTLDALEATRKRAADALRAATQKRASDALECTQKRAAEALRRDPERASACLADSVSSVSEACRHVEEGARPGRAGGREGSSRRSTPPPPTQRGTGPHRARASPRRARSSPG